MVTFAGREADALRIARGKRDRRFNAYNHVIEPLTNTIAPTLRSITQSSLVHTLHARGTTRPLAPTCLGFPVTFSTCTNSPAVVRGLCQNFGALRGLSLPTFDTVYCKKQERGHDQPGLTGIYLHP